jgi:glutathione peroxidase-family protein
VTPYTSLYEIGVSSLEGHKTLEEFKGKVLLIVNVATQ